jgi:hypothetical protein
MFHVRIVGCLVGFVEGLRIKGQKGWPAAEELRAASCCVGAIKAGPSVRAACPSCSGPACAS